jgi:MFS family permease
VFVESDPVSWAAVELSRRPRLAIAAGLAAQTSGSLPIAMIGATAPELQAEFAFGDSQLGMIAALYFVSGALLGPYGGRLIDRLGPAFGLRATGVIVIGCLLVTATAKSFTMLLVGAFIGATSMALATSSSNVVLVHHVPEKRRGFAFGLKQSAVPLAAMLSGLALPLIALRAGWRWAFVVMIIFPLASLLLAPTTPVEHRSRGERPTVRARPPRALYFLAGVGLFAATAVGTLSPFLVRAAIEAGFSTGSAGLLLSVAAGSLVISRVFWGAVIDRTGADPVWVISGLLAVGTFGYALLTSTTLVPFAIGAVVAYAFGWAWPGVQFLAGIRLWPGNPGEATGLLQTGAFIGAAIGPLIFGFLVERTGFSAGYACSAGAAAVAAGIAAWIAREGRRSPVKNSLS